MRTLLVLGLLLNHLLALAGSTGAGPSQGITPEQVAVIVNDADPNSVEIGAYYLAARHIPDKNLIHVSIPGHPRKLSLAAFTQLKQQIEANLPPETEAMVLAWTAPYAVECNAITAALTLGFDASQCKDTCAAGKPSPYFNAATAHPYADLGLRLSMLLPTDNLAQAKALIDRGVVSNFRQYPASAYFLRTADPDRNTRSKFFPPDGAVPPLQFSVKNLKANQLENAQDVMVYETGGAQVIKLETVRFLPGALADHLTSFGGDLLGKNQMSSLRWLEAGATASYGTVSEPCNYWQKFPNPTVLLKHYLSGATAIEAYWKSVAWPAQGLFIGEPLAAPYRR
ncbi:uncharacterized protein NMK_3022 [Novimethylophilus kurashikiensis]|uniref:TIGR03790 family protein n=1 Tax=Novimethylophilus kurashikiensis TaxID=1825523 RepID=A0A2R5FBK7_9PROT|nr:TIGR03790 family protein [Novimethylophilus kurashikiensis]GBG15415.1 uncharacterized protein NMK_3022 [Novimethylophilus kurashikiensis]